MVGKAVSFIQQQWRFRRCGVRERKRYERLELSKEYFKKRRWERLIRDLR
jgi:hypothetical protein